MRGILLPRISILLTIALLFAWASKPLSAAQHWIIVSTPQFEMYTTNSEKQAIRSLQVFEQVRYFFLQNSRNKRAPEEQVRIIAFSSEREFKRYRPNAGTFAYYQQGRERDYIVMQDIEPEHQRTALHEYTHLIVQHSKLDLPIWLNEGMADLYSSLEPHGQKAMVGRSIPDRLYTLQQQPWMDWNALFAVDHQSPYYNEKNKMSIFYAQSWALTHMLRLSPSYLDGFPDFVERVNNGTQTADALQKVYGKSVADVGKDVKAYVQQTTLRAVLYNVSLSKMSLDPRVGPATEFQSDLALAELLAAHRESAAEAKRQLLALKGQEPKNAEIDESLGYLAWQANNTGEARTHFASAVHNGSKDVQMRMDYAQLADEEDSSSQLPVDLARSAVAFAPDKTSAKILFSQLEAERHHYGSALGALAEVKRIEPDQAFEFFSVVAYCHANLRDFAGAKEPARKALSYAKTTGQRTELNNLISYIEEQSQGPSPLKPPLTRDEAPAPTGLEELRGEASQIQHVNLPHVAGITKNFECSNGAFRLRVQVGDSEMVFGMSDPKSIIVRGVKDLQWSCGPLNPQNITVFYKESADSKLAGTISELVF